MFNINSSKLLTVVCLTTKLMKFLSSVKKKQQHCGKNLLHWWRINTRSLKKKKLCKRPAVRMFKLEWQRRLTWLCRTANAVCFYTAKCIYDSMEQKCHLVVKVSPNIWSTNFYITHTSSLVHDQKFSSTNLLLASWLKKKWQQVGKFCSPWQ